MVTDGADTSDAAHRRTARQPQGAIDSGVHGRRRPGAVRARHPGDARRNAARGPQGHRARRRRRAVADRLRRPDRAAQRRRRRAHRRARRTSRCRPTASRRPCGCASPPTKPGARLFRFKIPPQDGEQVTQNNARDALIEVHDRQRKGPLLRRRAAVRDEVHPPRGRRRQEPAGRHPAAHGREQVLARRRQQPRTS